MSNNRQIWELGKTIRIGLTNSRLWLQNLFNKIAMPEYTVFSMLAILTGAAVGLASVMFHHLIHFFDTLFFNVLLTKIVFIGAGVIVIIPLLGMLIQALMIKLFPEIAKRKGVIDVIKSVATRGGYIPFRTTIFHSIAPAICMGSGGTVGPEGPAAQIGGGIASKLGQLFGLSDQRKRMFTAAGAGAAISAVFNTPLGGIFFAIEVILLNDFHAATFSALILASVTASAISRIFLGDSPAFQFDTALVGPYQDYYLFIILGLAVGILSLFYIRYSAKVSSVFRSKLIKKHPKWLPMAFVGLLVGISGYFYSDIFGIGYNTINNILASTVAWHLVVILLVLKFLLVPLVLSSGGFGGIFAPSLFMGASFGYLFAVALNYFFDMNVDTTTYTLVGMGAMLGGVSSIPISAILIIFEMTKDYHFMLPLMLAVVISSTIVQWRLKGSIQAKHLEEEGFELSFGRDSNILKSIQVKEVMQPDIFMVPDSLPIPSLVSQLVEKPHNVVYVTNHENKIVGVITDNEIRSIITEYNTLSKVLVASDIAIPKVKIVNENDILDYVFKLLGTNSIHQFPVCNNNGEIVGTVRRQDAIAAYNNAAMKNDVKDSLATELRTLSKSTVSKVADGYSIIEKKVPHAFVGKSMLDLQFRNIHGLEILMIKNKASILADDESDKIIIPDPNYKFMEEDTLVLFGSDESINKFKKL